MSIDPRIPPEDWLAREDEICRLERIARLSWLTQVAHKAEIWKFPGGWLSYHLFENARYCFIYGQFVATSLAGFSYMERTLAAMFYGAGRNDLERASSEKLFSEALRAGWLTQDEFDSFEKARHMRNPLVHYRKPLHKELPESRAMREGRDPNEVLESDAKHILEAVFRIIALNAVG